MSHLNLLNHSFTEKSPTCYLIGQDNLLVECAKLLRSKSFSILGVISPSKHIRVWMQEQEIPYFPSISEVNWQDHSADYLFSIVNNEIIPPGVLRRIRHLAINYHDAPLPHYAGSNATSWAIIQGEPNHAVTWHVVNEVIDGGDILKQHVIPLQPDETALSLNYKCAEQAIASFSALVDELVNHTYHRTPQDVQQRSYFARSKKPINNGWINWNDSAEQIDRLFRATQLGQYRNPYATTKIVLGEEVFVVDALTVLSEASGARPGSLLETTASYWNIATSTNTVQLSALSTTKGEPVELDTVASQYRIKVDTQLSSPSLQEGELLLTLSQEYFPHEAYWIEKLIGFQPTTVTSKQPNVNLRCLPQKVFDQFLHFEEDKEEVSFAVLATWLVYLHRLESQSQLNIFVDLGSSAVPNSLSAFFTTHLPFSITINDQDNFHQIIQQVRRECHHIQQHGSYLRDCWYRYPELAESIAYDHSGYLVTVGSITASCHDSEELLPAPFLTLCEELLRHSDRPLSEVDWLTQEERKKLLIEWNATEMSYPAHKTIHGLFEDQVTKTPHQLALIAEDVHLTYQELNVRANQLAHYLLAYHRIQPDQLIAVCLERSEWMLIALLAILKSGGAYVPLDPGYPEKRVSFIIHETKAEVIFTTQTQAQRLLSMPEIDGENTVLLMLDSPDFLSLIEKQPKENLNIKVTSRNLAYVMYTSGTTGTPKGIQIEHQGIVNRITWMNQAYPLISTDRVLQKTPYVFDVSVWELFWANWYGATTVFAKPGGHKEPFYLSQLIQKQQISILHFTPSMLNEFVQAIAHQSFDFSSLRHLFCSGEALHVATVQRAKTLLPHVAIHNLYGPTEASIDVLFYDDVDQQTVHLGKPINNTHAYVLDSDNRLLPVGVTGELHLAGDGLARGYLNQPELTAQQFIANPFQTEQDKRAGRYARLYKTGDLVRWLPDGNLEYLGRNDNQVKLHGYRIELEEIEQVIQRCPEVQQNVALIIDNQLVVYCVAEPSLDADSIQAHAAQYLPYYMVPNQVVFLKHLPLTINGKVDHKKLPLPQQSHSQEIVRPSNERQALMVEVFAAVLGLAPADISVTDDFFKLGGDSILAIRLVGRLNELLSQQIQVRDVLQLKTIQALSAILDRGERKAQDPEPVYEPFSLIDRQQYEELIHSGQIEDIYPASYLQMGMLLESSLNDQGTYHDVFYYEINLPFEKDKFLKIWEALAQKHALLRAKFWFSDQHGLDVVIFKTAHLHYQFYSDHPLQQLIDSERLNHFSHKEECLFHLIVNQHTDNFEFIFSFHHAIVDGWSVASLINEFVQAYTRDQPDLKNTAPQEATYSLLSYGEFVRSELKSLHDQGSMSFWESYLADSEPTQAKWKFDDISTSPDGLFTSTFFLTPEETRSVHQLAREQAISVDSVFLYAYIKTLSFFLNSDDITIGVVFNNRLEKTGGDTLLGLFLNVLPFRFQLGQSDGLPEALSKTFTEKMKLYAHKQIPYAHLKSTFKRDLYQFGFNFIHFHILKQSEPIIAKQGGFDRASIPFVLEVTQRDTFKLELKVHDDYVSQTYLDYFGHYLKITLQNFLQKKNEIALDANDYQKMVIDWNDTFQPFPSDKTLHQLFEEQVQRTPKAIALFYEGRQFTYQELNQHANQLAHYLLQQYQVMPDELVALCLDRNEWMVIGILAVLKSGAAYVPIEPSYPDERIFHILRDTNTQVILTDIKNQSRCNMYSQRGTCVIDDESPKIQRQPTSNPITSVKSSHLAYVIYTSGTTGKPNGVMIEHKGAINLILNIIEKHNLVSDKHVAFYSNYAFDASVYELFPALSIGCKVFLLPNPVRHDLQILVEYFTTNTIQVSFIPSNLASDFAQTYESSTLELINVGGERLVLDSDVNIGDLPYEIINEYGATETTVCTTWKIINKTKVRNPNTNIIGRPFANNTCYVLNVNRQSAPIGAIGELFIGGAGIARGYLNNPKLTNRKFIPNPFQTEDEKKLGINGRLYKTGDLVRWRPDGDLEYVARNDNQIKIWGYRIELSEIERVLNTHPDIKQSIVLQANDSVNSERLNNHLIAYYVKRSRDQKKITSHTNTELRAYLAQKLPKYMVPQYFVPIDNLPLTVNNKVDRNALPQVIFSLSDSYIPPKDEMERKMCALFANILGVPKEKIGITDDFFSHLGGSSIQSIKLITQINKVFQTDLHLRYMMTHGTVRQLLEVMATDLARNHNA